MPDGCTIELTGGIPVFRITRYFDEECGGWVNKTVDEHLCAGKLKFIIDFSGCKVINSPGVGKMLEVAVKITADFQGTLFLCGLDPLKRKVFLMARDLPAAREAANVETALRELQKLP